ncbi:YjcZ family sporulation protein [Bacillus cereus]|uniref:YjcZ family sporulation protein n=1 Tax=Bacillus cereus TaxID=1396 RepID=UPI00363AF635
MYGYSYCYPTCSYPSYGYGGSYGGSCGGSGRGFALIVVLFILLIIVGAACIR